MSSFGWGLRISDRVTIIPFSLEGSALAYQAVRTDVRLRNSYHVVTLQK